MLFHSSSSSSSSAFISCLTLLLIALTTLISSADALYFILDGTEQKCFVEELPKEMTVIGTYTALEWSEASQKFEANSASAIQIVIEENATRHRIKDQKGTQKGKFSFTTLESGDHTICINAAGGSGWFTSVKTKVIFDLMFGDVSHDVNSGKKTVVNDLTQRVRDLNGRINVILR
ncbi:emp24p/erv25p- protein, partial [Blyttiomyces sp. JEL0837]